MSDVCSTPGIFWAYGDPSQKKFLAFLQWNSLCCREWVKVLADPSTNKEERKNAIKQIEIANTALERQAHELLRLRDIQNES